jgi:hypothetical protein
MKIPCQKGVKNCGVKMRPLGFHGTQAVLLTHAADPEAAGAGSGGDAAFVGALGAERKRVYYVQVGISWLWVTK